MEKNLGNAKLVRWVALAAAAATMINGCKSLKPITQEQQENFKLAEFVNIYTNNWPKQERRVGDEMVHLGMPTQNQLVVWYALDENSHSDGGQLKVAVLKDGNALGHLLRTNWFNQELRVGRYEIHGLEPGTTYDVEVSSRDGARKKYLKATTAPSGDEGFSFLVTSCFQPYFHTNGLKDTYISRETVESLRALRDRATNASRPAFILGLGDQFYADPGAKMNAPISLLYGNKGENLKCNVEDSARVLAEQHRLHLALKPMDEAMAAVPMAMMWDDHDIADGWGAQGHEHKPYWRSYYRGARRVFESYQVARNPNFNHVQLMSEWKDLEHDGAVHPSSGRTNSETYFTFDWGGASFFVTDSRSEKNYKRKTTLTEEQISGITNWLANNHDDNPKVLVFTFSVPLSQGPPRSNWIRNVALGLFSRELQDDWRDRATFSNAERERILKMLFDHVKAHKKHRLLIVSGDVHYGGVQVIWDLKGTRTEEDDEILGYEVVSSGLAQSEFNHKGAYWGSISGKVAGGFVENHGYYAGPNFSEIFIGKDEAGNPDIKMMMYGVTTYSNELVRLNVSGVSKEIAYRPEDAPANERGKTSILQKFIFETNWVTSPRIGKEPKGRATDW